MKRINDETEEEPKEVVTSLEPNNAIIQIRNGATGIPIEMNIYDLKNIISEWESDHHCLNIIAQEEQRLRISKELRSLIGIYFTLHDGNQGLPPKFIVKQAILYAQESIDILMYQLSDIEIIQELITKMNYDSIMNQDIDGEFKRVQIRIILDVTSLDNIGKDNHALIKLLKHSELDRNKEFCQIHFGTGLKNNYTTVGLIHHKMMIIDKILILKGSYNYTKQAGYLNYEDLECSLPSERDIEIWNKRFTYLWNKTTEWIV